MSLEKERQVCLMSGDPQDGVLRAASASGLRPRTQPHPAPDRAVRQTFSKERRVVLADQEAPVESRRPPDTLTHVLTGSVTL